jgi:predicted transcriptional regulator
MKNIKDIPIESLNRSLESFKTQDLNEERKLLGKLAEEDLREPISIVGAETNPLVIDGYKRLRCAEKLKWTTIACSVIEEEEGAGIIEFLNRARGKKTNMYEISCFVIELLKKHKMNNGEIAIALGRSKSWVSLRIQFFTGMSDKTKTLIQKGKFPLHAWIYSIRPFTRVNSITVGSIDTFTKIISDSNYSLREINILSKVWFSGEEQQVREIKEGHADWILNRIEKKVQEQSLMSSFEQDYIKTLESLKKSMLKVLSYKSPPSLSHDFKAQSDLFYLYLLGSIDDLKTKLEALKC